MMIRSLLAALILTALFAGDALGCPSRNQAEKRRFALAHPCPTTGKPLPSCPGYVIDHRIPLCARGADKATNMQWQTLVEAHAKDRREAAYCACRRKSGAANCSFQP